jgi:hypothetical protein
LFGPADNENSVLQLKRHDLAIKSLYPAKIFCPLDNQLISENTPSLCLIINLAHKSVAQLTSTIAETKSEDHDLMPATRKAIYQLMIKHLPEINVKNIWWTNQGPLS